MSRISGYRRTAAAAALLLCVSGAITSAPRAQAGATVAASAAGQPTAVEVSQDAPDPSLEPIRVTAFPSRQMSTQGCASFRWLGLCAYAGYAMSRSCHRSWCGVLGALTHRGKRVYRTDMDSSVKTHGLRAGHRLASSKRASKGSSHCRWGKRRGQVAAYLLAKYGATGANNRRAAAVDLALNHLLCKKYKLGKVASNKRLGARAVSASSRKAIRRQARQLVKASQQQAGPYRLRVTAKPAVGSSPVTVRASLRTGAGRAAPNRRLVLRLTGGTTADAYTNGRGIATWSFSMEAGTQVATVRAPALEARYLFVRAPKNKKAARVLVAGRTYKQARKVLVTTKQLPTAKINGGGTKIPRALPGSLVYSDSLGTAAKTVSVELRGPFSSPGVGSCTSGAVARSASFTITGNGSYDLPKPGSSAAPKKPGYYRWRVAVAEDDQNAPVQACSNPYVVKKATPRVVNSTMTPPSGTVFSTGQQIKPAAFTYENGYGAKPRPVRVVLWGPFSTKGEATCTAPPVKRAKSAKWTLTTAQGRFALMAPEGPRAKVSQPGWYRFGVKVSSNATNEAAQGCGAAFRVK